MVQGDEPALTDGIEPDWWARAVSRGSLILGDGLAYYYSGRIELNVVQGLVLFDVEPEEGISLLAVTATSLAGVHLRKQGNPAGVSISRSAVPLSEVRRVDTSWTHWIDPRDLGAVDLSPSHPVTAEIELRTELGEFGDRIRLPLDRHDYRGEPSDAVRGFTDALSRQMAPPTAP